MINIAIIGKMASGKTTLANKINEKIFKNAGCICSFAGPIKEIYKRRELLSHFTITINDFIPNNTRETTLLEYEPFMKVLDRLDNELVPGTKPRKHFQFLGDFFKKIYGENFWVNKLFEDFKMFNFVQISVGNNIKALIIDDFRMNIEFETLINRNENFIIICLELDEDERLKIIKNNSLGDLNTLTHNSETEVDDIIGIIKSNAYDNMYDIVDKKRKITIYSTKNKPISKSFIKNIVINCI